MDNKEVTLTLTIETLNVIMAALGETPYRVSAPVVQLITEQVQPQLQKQTPEAANDD